MVVAELLELAGAPSSWVLVGVALLGVYHLRSGIGFLSRVSTVVQITGVVAVALVAAAAGLIPGVDLSIAFDTLMGSIDALTDGFARTIEAIV